MEAVKEKYPDYKFFAIGHSFGANILFKYLGICEKNSPLVGAVSVANPFDLYLASKYIKGTIYEGFITTVRQTNLKKKRSFYEQHSDKYGIDLDKALSVKTAKEYDEYFSRRVYGYPTVDNYYRDVSCAAVLHDVHIPSLLIQSYDDPIIQ